MFLLRYSQQMSPLPSHTRRRLQQLHQRCLPECKFLARTCWSVLALKSFWSCCRYVIVWVFFFSSYMLSLYLSGALIPGLSEERCLHRYSDAPAKHRRRFLENDLWPEFLLHCDVEWNRGDRWSMLFFFLFKIRKVTDQKIQFSWFLLYVLHIFWKVNINIKTIAVQTFHRL